MVFADAVVLVEEIVVVVVESRRTTLARAVEKEVVAVVH